MKKVVRLYEHDLKKVIKVILEQRLEEEDYVHVFLNSFSKWMSEKYPKTFETKPLSYLVKKYTKEFVDDLGLGQDGERDYWSGLRLIGKLGREIINKGLYKYASLRPETKFTEKFEKKLPYFIDKLELPKYVTLHLKEDLPWKIEQSLELDFVSRLKDPEFKRMYSSGVLDKFEKYITNYMGIETGNSEHGELEFRREYDFLVKGFEEWVKTDYKKLKKEIKSIPGAEGVQRIVLELDKRNAEVSMQIVFKADSRWDRDKEYINRVKDYIEQKGYNTEVLKVSRK